MLLMNGTSSNQILEMLVYNQSLGNLSLTWIMIVLSPIPFTTYLIQ